MKNFLLFVMVSLFGCTTFASTSAIFDRMVVFGDSYSDNGNLFKLTQGQYPYAAKYFKGRFSNGPVWSEYLAHEFNIDPDNSDTFINYAYAGAKVLSPVKLIVPDFPEVTNKHYRVPDMSQQISAFQKKYKKFNNRDLIVVFIATNDFFDLPKVKATSFFKKIANKEVQQIDRLIQLGAQHIIVLNGGNVTLSPYAKIVAAENTNSASQQKSYLRDFEHLIEIYNKQLAWGLAGKNQVFLYDNFNFDNTLKNKIDHGGFSYQFNSKKNVLKFVNSACYPDDQGITGAVCNNPQQYFFYDTVHHTSYVSYLLAKSVHEKVMKRLNMESYHLQKWLKLPPTPTLPKAEHSGFSPVNGINIWYATYGQGEPVVLLHGGLGNSNYWANQIPVLAKHYRVIVMDSRGHGRSTRDKQPYSYELMASDVIGLMDFLKIKQAAIVGWSDGAILGLDIAIHHPDRVSKLFAFGANSRPSAVKDTSKNAVFNEFMARAEKEYKTLSGTPTQYHAFLDQISKMWATQPNLTKDQLNTITVPTWIVDGEYDEAIKRGDTEFMAAQIPNAILLIQPRVSHFSFLQDPEQFNEDLLHFLVA